MQQGVPHHLLACLARDVSDQNEQAERLKKAVAALAYVSGEEIGTIERLLARHGGGFDGAAGPIRAIASQTSDLIGGAARVAELLHLSLQLGDRVEKLNLRLTFGIPAAAVELARYAGGNLTRGDYRRLVAARLCGLAEIAEASDDELLVCVDGSRARLIVLRAAIERHAERTKIEISGGGAELSSIRGMTCNPPFAIIFSYGAHEI